MAKIKKVKDKNDKYLVIFQYSTRLIFIINLPLPAVAFIENKNFLKIEMRKPWS